MRSLSLSHTVCVRVLSPSVAQRYQQPSILSLPVHSQTLGFLTGLSLLTSLSFSLSLWLLERLTLPLAHIHITKHTHLLLLCCMKGLNMMQSVNLYVEMTDEFNICTVNRLTTTSFNYKKKTHLHISTHTSTNTLSLWDMDDQPCCCCLYVIFGRWGAWMRMNVCECAHVLFWGLSHTEEQRLILNCKMRRR